MTTIQYCEGSVGVLDDTSEIVVVVGPVAVQIV